ncbi:MAG TPA: rod shape-determining protein [Pirellulales bacterium]|jgi:rod shape-determining protein MreB
MLSRLSNLLRCDLAVDLGTATTRVALVGEGVVLEEPSVVAVSRNGNRMLSGGCAVGHLARQMWGRTPDSVSVVRPLAAGVITDFQLCEAMLRYFLNKARPRRYGLRPRLLLAAPGCLTPVERRAIYTTAHRAGAGQVRLLGVAEAAALGAQLPIAEPVASMIIDIGAGSTEVAVLSLADVVACQSIRVGGDQMDQAIVDWLRRARGLRVGLSSAEQLRIGLGSALAEGNDQRRDEIRGVDLPTGLPRRMEISASEVRAALAGPLERILDAIRATLDDCSPDLVADLVDRGVMLCGGGALLAGLDRWITERTGLPARVATEPRLAVVNGTLTCLEHLDAWRKLLAPAQAA